MITTTQLKGRPYAVLNALDPLAFLRPEDFRTEYDAGQPSYAREQYEKGRRIADEAQCIHICVNSTWAATYPGGVTTSSEGIGYHGCTADLLRGFLDGDAPIRVHRADNPEGVLIQPRAWSHHCHHCGEPVKAWKGPEPHAQTDWVDQVGLSICDASGRKHEPHSPA